MRHAEITWSVVCSVALHSQFDEGARPHCTRTNEDNASPHAIELSPSYFGEAYFKWPSTGLWNEITEHGCTFGVLCNFCRTFIIRPLSRTDV